MNPGNRTRAAWRFLFALSYFVAGIFHLALPDPFLAITPGWVRWPAAVVMLTGIAELVGGIGLAQPFAPRLRRAAAIGLALYAVCVFPANINQMMLDMAKPEPSLGWGYHLPRMLLQPILVWLALWTGEVTDWPFQRRSPAA